MSVWVGLLGLICVPLVVGFLIWTVPVWVCAQGELRGERKGWAVSVGLVMGLIGLKAASEGRQVEVRLLIFRRPWMSLRRRRRPAIHLPPSAPVAAGPPRHRREEATRPEADAGRASTRIGKAWGYVDRFRRPARRFLQRIRRSFRVQGAALDIDFGAKDPATTGQLCGFLYAVRPLLGPKARIGVWPDFLTRRFEGNGSVVFSVSIARITWAATALAVRIGGPLGWDYLRNWWKGRRDRRRKPGVVGIGGPHHSEALIP